MCNGNIGMLDIVRTLNALNDDNLAEEVKRTNYVQNCLLLLEDMLELSARIKEAL